MHDLRLAVRSLCSTPIVTCVAVLSLALGIGANTAIFSLVNSLVLKPLPVRNPQRLYLLSAEEAAPLHPPQFSYATFKLLREVAALEGVSGSTNCCGKSIVSIGTGREMANRVFVTGDYFSTLGVNAARGRLFTLNDDEPNAPDGPVVVVGYRMWRDGLGGREDVVGLRLTIDAVAVTVVGVAPPDFRGAEVGRDVDLFAPQHLAPRMTSTPMGDDNAWLNVFVRLKAGMTLADATAGLRAAQARIREASMPKPPSPRFLVEPFALIPADRGTSRLRDRFEQPLFVLFVVVACVLIISCANIGNLLLARAIARRHELSVRVALGASRLRLARQFFVESALVALLGAAAGLLVASWAIRALLATMSDNTRADPAEHTA